MSAGGGELRILLGNLYSGHSLKSLSEIVLFVGDSKKYNVKLEKKNSKDVCILLLVCKNGSICCLSIGEK